MLQTVLPELQVPQSPSVKQGLLQKAFTHSWPLPHSALLWHWGTRPVDGWHTPPMQESLALAQAVAAVQSAWQMPLMQVELAPQSLLWTHAPVDGTGAGAQWPDWQVSPVPQSASTLQAGWQAPAVHTPPEPHCESAVQGLELPVVVHVPLLHTWPDGQPALLVQLAEVPAGVHVWFWQVVPAKAAQSESLLQMPVSLHVPLLQ